MFALPGTEFGPELDLHVKFESAAPTGSGRSSGSGTGRWSPLRSWCTPALTPTEAARTCSVVTTVANSPWRFVAVARASSSAVMLVLSGPTPVGTSLNPSRVSAYSTTTAAPVARARVSIRW